MRQPKYIRDHDKKFGTKMGLPKIKQQKQKKRKKGYVYNTGKGLEVETGNKSMNSYWNTRNKY